jgi:hypothetical protein
MSGPNFGWQGQFGIGDSTPVNHRFDIQRENFTLNENIKDCNGLRGIRSHSVERLRNSTRRVEGSVTFWPTANELVNLLPWIMAGTPSGTGTVTYPLGDVQPTKYVVIDRGAGVHTYNGCMVDKAHFRSSQGEPLEVTLDIVGLDETVGAAGSFPALDLDIASAPFMYFDAAVTVGGVSVIGKDVELSIDNALNKDRYFNSPVLKATYPMDRIIEISTTLPYGDASALYGTGLAGNGAVIQFTFTDGAQVLTMTANNAKFPRNGPTMPGREEIMFPLRARCFRSGIPPGGTQELVLTLKPS